MTVFRALMTLIRTVVRPFVTALLTGMFCYGFWAGTISAEQFVPVVTLVLGFWFGSRNTTARGEHD